MEAVFPSNRNVFVNEFSIPGGGNRLSVYPVDTRRKLNVHKTSWTSSERLIHAQFTSCVYEVDETICFYLEIFVLFVETGRSNF